MQPLRTRSWRLRCTHTRRPRRCTQRCTHARRPRENWPRPIAFPLLSPLPLEGQVTMGGGRGLIGKDCPASPLSQLSGYPNLLILWGKFLKSPQFPNETTTGREVIISIYSAQIDYKLLAAPKIVIYGNLIQSRSIRDINNTIIFWTRKIISNLWTFCEPGK